MLYGLDLFSGIGGNTLALREWVKTIAYCEKDPYARSVLLSRMGDGSIPLAPIWDDVTTLRGTEFPDGIDIIIIGGFPCQDVSVAGKGSGLGGKRSGLVFEVFRLLDELGPEFVFLENVPGIRTRGIDIVVRELDARGYDTRWACVDAGEVGASHVRTRWFLLANNSRQRMERGWPKRVEIPRPLARTQIFNRPGEREREIEPDLRRSVHDVSDWMDRLRCLGNSVVPAQAREAFKRLMGV